MESAFTTDLGDTFGDNGGLATGARLNGYVIEKRLGQGGLGAVYLARHEVLDTLFALKVLDPKMAEDKPEYVTRFVREAKLASRIRHPNLVAVHDAGYDEKLGVYYLVMDYVQGSTLRQAIALGGAMSSAEAARVVLQVASALQAAQRFGMVHRDIKPENIMIMQDGNVKLIDLGVAKVAEEMDTLKTMENSVFGTLSYVSPEQATDASRVDIRADIYSLGIVFFEMLSGRLPYKDKDPGTIILELMNPEPLPDVREFNPDVPPEISALVQKMCAKKPEDRISSPNLLIEALANLGYKIGTSEDVGYAETESVRSFASAAVPSGAADNTLTLDTQDTEMQAFVKGIKRRRLFGRLAWVAAALGVVLTLILLFLFV